MEIQKDKSMDREQESKRKSAQFWRQVSNGLRTSLNVIRGTADIGQNEIYDIETVRRGFRQIELSSDYLLDVVNDIVDYVTIENHNLEIENTALNLNDLVSGLVAKYYKNAAEEGKHFDAQIHGVLHERLLGDGRRVEKILECMIVNSLKYTSKKDKLYFRVFETGVSEKKTNMRFTLTGTNRRIYDSLCGTVNGKIVTDATDLALYNCHYILTQMGGKIEVILDEERNSEIVIDMPFEIEEDAKGNDDTGLFANQNILIICDEKSEAEERGQLLREMGVSYETAADAEEALDKIGMAEEKGHAFTVCVVDWNIHSFKLQSFVNEVHTIFGRTLSLIAMAYNDEAVEEEALEFGFDYVMKSTWFRSTICDILMKNTQGSWKQMEINPQSDLYNFENKHILVVEDAVLNREFIERILTNVRADVTCAINGIEAFNIYRQKPEHYFDCILMDVNMPDMDGYEATRKIRNSGREDAKSIPVFALTANAFQSDIRETLEAGMNGHFSKPVDIVRLYATLKRVFQEVEKGTYTKDTPIWDMEKTNGEAKDVQTDSLTGLLSVKGLEKRLLSPQFLNSAIGFLLADVNDFEQILMKYGKKKADDLLCIVAKCLKETFRNSDLVARYSTSCFAIVVNNCDSKMEFAQNKVDEINRLLTNGQEYLNAGICVGASYAAYGYSKKLVEQSYEALNRAKRIGRAGCCVLEITEDEGNTPSNYLNQYMLGEEMYNLGGTGINQIEKVNELLNLILGNNQAIGIMCGTYEKKLPITSISKFALNNLGYDLESFVKTVDLKLENLIYEDDLNMFIEYAPEHEMEVRKLRLRHKNGSALWFNAAYIQAYAQNGEKMWIASFRLFDENMIGRLCNMNYKTVSIIFPKDNSVLFEKGAEEVYTGNLKLRKKYNYESLLKDVFVKMQKDSEKEEFLYQTNIAQIVKRLANKGNYEFVSYQRQKDGSMIPLRHKYRYLDNAEDAIFWTTESVSGLVEGDTITSLLNETGFSTEVKQILQRPENAEKNYAIVYMNIKDFKSCNEVLGYANGNVLLRQYAELVENSKLRPVCGARFHADQFCFLVEEEHLDLDELFSLCAQKMIVNNNAINIRLHSGIYHIEDKEQEVTIMCNKAVLATRRITNEYAMPYYEFDESVNQQYQNRVFVLNNLERAFTKDEFRVYYQPVCDVKTGKICSAEALVRWIMPGGKIVSPGTFIPVLENKGFISKLDLLVADKVKQFLEARTIGNQQVVPVSINLSRMDFLNESFMRDLHSHIEGIVIDKSLFRYEVTESAYINVGKDGKTILEDIRKNKSMIYIDDFGTGYSSLQNLMEIHFDILKLDMSFVRKIGLNTIAEEIIDASIQVCHRLERKVIAEGVETEEQYRFLAERDCDYIQGYYFYKPVSEEEFVKLLEQ